MTAHRSTPYLKLPDARMWVEAFRSRAGQRDHPHTAAGFTIASTDKVPGSCFAQRISEALKEAGYGYLVTEPAPTFRDRRAIACSYGVYSARYENIYSSLPTVAAIDPGFRWVFERQ